MPSPSVSKSRPHCVPVKRATSTISLDQWSTALLATTGAAPAPTSMLDYPVLTSRSPRENNYPPNSVPVELATSKVQTPISTRSVQSATTDVRAVKILLNAIHVLTMQLQRESTVQQLYVIAILDSTLMESTRCACNVILCVSVAPNSSPVMCARILLWTTDTTTLQRSVLVSMDSSNLIINWSVSLVPTSASSAHHWVSVQSALISEAQEMSPTYVSARFDFMSWIHLNVNALVTIIFWDAKKTLK